MRGFDEINDDVRRVMGTHDAEALLQLSIEFEQLGTEQGRAAAANTRGSTFLVRSMYFEALHEFERSLAIYEQINIPSGIAAVLVNIGSCQRLTGDLRTASSYFDRARQIYADIKNDRGLASVLQSLGSVFYEMGNYPSALEHFNKSLELWTTLHDDDATAKVYFGVGSIYRTVGDYPKALEYYEQGRAIGIRNNNRFLIATTSSYIGTLYLELEQYPKAHGHFARSLDIHQSMGNRQGVSTALTNLALAEIHLEQQESAVTRLRQAIEIAQEIGDPGSLTHRQISLAQLLFDMQRMEEFEALLPNIDPLRSADPRIWIAWHILLTKKAQHQHDDDRAEHELQTSLALASQHGLMAELSVIHKNLRDHARTRNDLEGYVKHNDEYLRIKDTINGKDTAERIALQEAERAMAAERAEHERHLAVLHSTLPKHIADRVSRGEQVTDHYDHAAVIFIDIVDFTTLSSTLPSSDVVNLLSTIFSTFDAICDKHGVTKIKTIGDSYMAVSLPSESSSSQQQAASVAQRAANAALEMLDAASKPMIEVLPDLPDGLREALPESLQVRIGLNVGAVTAGVIGKERLQYDVWGDTVNVASRMESTGEAGKIHVSESFALLLSPSPSHLRERGDNSPFPIPYSLRERGAIEVKGKGPMTTFWLESL